MANQSLITSCGNITCLRFVNGHVLPKKNYTLLFEVDGKYNIQYCIGKLSQYLKQTQPDLFI